MNSKRLSCQQAASRALSCAATGQLPNRTQGRASCHSTHVCTHTPVLKSLFFQNSNGLTSTPAALPEDRQALELRLFLTHTAALSRNDRTHRGWPAAKAGAAAALGLNFPSAVRAVPATS